MFVRLAPMKAILSVVASVVASVTVIAASMLVATPALAKLPADSAITLDLNIYSIAQEAYPKGPQESVTPGSLCEKPTQVRYPERIKYCKRKVDTETKRAIIRNYDHLFGYSIGQMDRQKFKIDHLIPLCAGGSNEVTNLWPQHVSVYNETDPLEQELCEKMSQGRLLQAYAVELILTAKRDLTKVGEVRKRINDL